MRRVKQETTPRVLGGVDYGAPGKVLVRAPNGDDLVWRRGHADWDGVGRRAYRSACLQLRSAASRHAGGVWLHEGGRLSKALLARYAEKIDVAFGAGTAAKVDVHATLVL